jgi:HEAT repeat protein
MLGPAAAPATGKLLDLVLRDPYSPTQRSSYFAITEIGVGAVPVLQSAALSSDAPLKSVAVDLLKVIGAVGNPSLEVLLRLLKDPSLIVRQNTLELIGKLGPRAINILDEVIAATKETCGLVPGAAARALGYLGCTDEKVILALLARSEDSDWVIRLWALESLEQLGALKRVPSPSKLVHEDPAVRMKEASDLAKCGKIARFAILPLVRALKDTELEVGKAAEDALERIAPGEGWQKWK